MSSARSKGTSGEGALARFSRRTALSSLAATVGAAAAGMAHVNGGSTAAPPGRWPPWTTPPRTAGTPASARRQRRPQRQRLRPAAIVRDFDWRQGIAAARRAHAARVGADSGRQGDRDRARASTFAAWTYNGRIPGPTLRCTEGERLRIRFTNGSAHPHTIHFHGIHPPRWTACPGSAPGRSSRAAARVYEFDALPAGLHLYHCHVRPLAEHIAKGLYGAFIVDPKERRARRPTSW